MTMRLSLVVVLALSVHAKDLNPDRLKPHQILTTNAPPASPQTFNPDPLAFSVFELPAEEGEPVFELSVRISTGEPPRAPAWFDPDPGGKLPVMPAEPFFKLEYKPWPPYGEEPVAFPLPRFRLRTVELVEIEPEAPREPLPEKSPLPRTETRINERINEKWEDPEYFRHPAATNAVVNRWRVNFTPWQRYTDRPAETPYQSPTPALWNPYRQSILKGDVPVIGQDIFLNVTAISDTLLETRRLPTPSGVSADQPTSAEFFGQGEQYTIAETTAVSLELFQGETVFQPVHWAIKVEPAYNVNYTKVEERGVVKPDPAFGTDRFSDFATLQQWFGELHLGDLSDNYDFWAMRAGSQPFNSDFRGFIFNDINLGARVFGNADNNRFQYNVAAFPMREKDTNSELNEFDARDQYVFIANLYRQDFLWHGYTAQVSFHANLDNGQTHYDKNGNITRPEPLGTVKEHDVHAYYLGWTGDGHIGRWNVDHAFYQAFGRDDFNGLAGRPVDINAQMGALEVSYDRDWIRYKASFFYASGDSKAEDGEATGFDTIVDNPTFIGGPFSFYAHQGFNLAGTSVALKQRNSLVPDLRTSKVEGQANFVNPGVFIFGLGTDIDVLPKLKTFVNVNYIRFAETDTFKTALLDNKVNEELGLDCSIGFTYRPLLTDNIVINAGFGALVPGAGYRDIYNRSFPFNALCTVTLTY
jgi:hypothetical protein